MRGALIVVAAVGLTACGPNLSQVQSGCGAELKTFSESWPCVRAGMAKIGVSPDLREAYIATGDIVDERVRAGQMTDAEARLTMAKARQEAINTEESRSTGAATRAALYRANRPQYVAPNPVITSPMATTNCQASGGFLNCTTYGNGVTFPQYQP